MSRRRPSKPLTKKELIKKSNRLKLQRAKAEKIIQRIKSSLVVRKPKKSCSTCKFGTVRYGGHFCAYEGTQCALLYNNTFVSNPHNAFKEQMVQRNTVCGLHENR